MQNLIYEIAVTGRGGAESTLYVQQNHPTTPGSSWLSITFYPSPVSNSAPYECSLTGHGLELEAGLAGEIEHMINSEVAALWKSSEFAWRGQIPDFSKQTKWKVAYQAVFLLPLALICYLTLIWIPVGTLILRDFYETCDTVSVYKAGHAVSSLLIETAYKNLAQKILVMIQEQHPKAVLRPFDMPCDYPLDRGNQPYLAWVVEEDPSKNDEDEEAGQEIGTSDQEKIHREKMDKVGYFMPAPTAVTFASPASGLTPYTGGAGMQDVPLTSWM